MILNLRQTAYLLHRIALSTGRELDKNMEVFFNASRLKGETDEEFLNRVDETIWGVLDDDGRNF